MFVQIVTPDRVALEIEARMALLPGELGDFAVLDKHEPMMVLIKEGAVEIKDYEDLCHNYVVGSGMVYIEQTKCVVLTAHVASSKNGNTPEN
ncbi:ATP-synt_DE_N domain-containing protein [Alphaproteobacteria bacterium]